MATWSGLAPIGDFGGIVAMASLVPLRTGAGHYMALFHDDGRFIAERAAEGPRTFTVFKTVSADGGLTWGAPEAVVTHPEAHLCEPGAFRSPDGKQIAVLLRENSRKLNTFVIVSNDEGRTWSAPRQVPGALTGDRHVAKYAPDGRLFITFRDMALESATRGDWVAWVGTYDDIVNGREGQYRVRLMDNHHAWDCAYPGLELLPDGTFVTTTYGYWEPGAEPYIVSVRFTMNELDQMAAAAVRPESSCIGRPEEVARRRRACPRTRCSPFRDLRVQDIRCIPRPYGMPRCVAVSALWRSSRPLIHNCLGNIALAASTALPSPALATFLLVSSRVQLAGSG